MPWTRRTPTRRILDHRLSPLELLLLVVVLGAGGILIAQRFDSDVAASAPAASLHSVPDRRTPFRSCAQARAAGAAPVLVGQPGYAPWLDRDGDGIGCEPYLR